MRKHDRRFAKLAFYGGDKGRRRDILNKWKKTPTSEGTKERGFGNRSTGRRIIRTPRGSGELRTEPAAPPHPTSVKFKKSPFRRAARKQGSFMAASVELTRQPLLLDHHVPT